MGQKIPIKSSDDLIRMRESCQITARILKDVGSIIKPGISTEEINTFVHKKTVEQGAVPSPLNYKGYPKSTCVSVNDVICHGIPSPFEFLKAGDIVNVDISCYKNGFHGDASAMFFVGGRDACSPEAQQLVDKTHEALMCGIEVVRPGARVGDIGAAIQQFIEGLGLDYGIVREYTGHGIGRSFHESPQILHFGKHGIGDLLKPGMTFTIEPMINAGSWKTVLSKVDGWTVRTADGSLSAQWEHTVLVTEAGYEILTVS